MAIPLSDRTCRLIDCLFEEPFRSQLRAALVESVSGNKTPEGLDRVRFAVVKLVANNTRNLDRVINLAQTDYRDLLMAAGFGHDIDQHNDWYDQTVAN